MNIIIRKGKIEEFKEYAATPQDVLNFINEKVPTYYSNSDLPIEIKFNKYPNSSYKIYTTWGYDKFCEELDKALSPKFYSVIFEFHGYSDRDKAYFKYTDGIEIPYQNLEEDKNRMNDFVDMAGPVAVCENSFDLVTGTIKFKDWLTYKTIYMIEIDQIFKSRIAPLVARWEEWIETREKNEE